METTLHLYIWNGFCPDYTNGLAVAIAKSRAEAERLVEAEHGGEVWQWGELEVHPLNKPVAACVSGGG